jgi:hypothetical protein
LDHSNYFHDIDLPESIPECGDNRFPVARVLQKRNETAQLNAERIRDHLRRVRIASGFCLRRFFMLPDWSPWDAKYVRPGRELVRPSAKVSAVLRITADANPKLALRQARFASPPALEEPNQLVVTHCVIRLHGSLRFRGFSILG